MGVFAFQPEGVVSFILDHDSFPYQRIIKIPSDGTARENCFFFFSSELENVACVHEAPSS